MPKLAALGLVAAAAGLLRYAQHLARYRAGYVPAWLAWLVTGCCALAAGVCVVVFLPG